MSKGHTLIEYKRLLTSNEAFQVLRSQDRYSFILDYPFFGMDKNDEVYKSFIMENIETKDMMLFSDLLELAELIDFFDKSIFDIVKKKLFLKHGLITKLSCIRYLLCFYKEIGMDEYVEINTQVYKKSSNPFVKFTAIRKFD